MYKLADQQYIFCYILHNIANQNYAHIQQYRLYNTIGNIDGWVYNPRAMHGNRALSTILNYIVQYSAYT